MDEQERIYAPEEVPGGVQVPQEMDEGGTAASGTAAASHGEFFEESESTEESERREGG
jgi:hypothetical protein